MQINPNTSEAYKLLHNGVLALSRAEQQGIRIDLDYCNKAKEDLTTRIDLLEKALYDTNFYRHWSHSIGNKKPNIYSNTQLSFYLYKTKKIEPVFTTKSGQGSTDEEALTELNIPELNDLLAIRRLKKVRDTYLEAFLREQVNGYIHPSFNLHLVKTFRSCVAKGTLILAVRDFLKYPKGIPIEEIKKGDFIYCFDNNLNPSIQKVLWAGKTGYKEVIRIHYSVNGKKEKGFVDVTPEHKIRLIDGSYVEAQKLTGDLRGIGENKHTSKRHVLSCARKADKLNFTGHLFNGTGILEHRLIYEELVGELNGSDIIHHKNGIHLDHSLTNLECMTLSDHSSYHGLNITEERKVKRATDLRKASEKIIYKSGIENANNLKFSKFHCYRLLSNAGGKFKYIPHDFTSFKYQLKVNGINIEQVKLRYDKNGKYIWKSALKKLSKSGRSEVSKILGMNFSKVLQLYELYQLDISRKWGNQYGEFKPGNHNITGVEWINKKVDVYDIEVEKYHNFFANEICVHNSSDSPNFQNIPKRDKEAMKIVRQALFPREGHLLMEADYSGLEVRIAACFHKDPVMLRYINDTTTDMHRDMAQQLFLIDKFNPDDPTHKLLRGATKNGFVFPEFYGSWYKNCAVGLVCSWGKLPRTGKWKAGQGIKFENTYLADHLISKGFNSLEKYMQHVKEVENDFWGVRFKEYTKWKERHWKAYQKCGYIDLKTGFRCYGVMAKNDVINYPVQGSAFHCNLWALTQLDKFLREHDYDTRIIGQIHDSIVLDVHPDELQRVSKIIRRITCVELLKAFTWINVPLDVEIDIGKVDASWAEMEKMEEN
jgi:hypothetical protein